MEEKKDNLDILQSYIDKQNTKADPPDDKTYFLSMAKQRATEKYVTKSAGNKFFNLYASLTCLLLLITIVIISIFATLNGKVELRYFDDDELTYETIESVSVFCAENGVDIKYFDFDDIISLDSLAYYVENDEFVILYQRIYCISSTGLDILELNVSITNDEFNRFYDYTLLSDNVIYNDIMVYVDTTLNDKGLYDTLARFEYLGNRYYLKISSLSDDPLIHYLDLLI